LNESFEEIKTLIIAGVPGLEKMSADGLLIGVDKLISGEKVGRDDFPKLQAEAERQESQRHAQRVIQQQIENEQQLDIALKMEQAKKQQILQKRLLAKSRAKFT
jgi:hypothetical protein